MFCKASKSTFEKSLPALPTPHYIQYHVACVAKKFGLFVGILISSSNLLFCRWLIRQWLAVFTLFCRLSYVRQQFLWGWVSKRCTTDRWQMCTILHKVKTGGQPLGQHCEMRSHKHIRTGWGVWWSRNPENEVLTVKIISLWVLQLTVLTSRRPKNNGPNAQLKPKVAAYKSIGPWANPPARQTKYEA
jgi:hypothetical protein